MVNYVFVKKEEEGVMTKQIVLRAPPASVYRRQPLLDGQDFTSRGAPRPTCRRSTRLAELVGGTTAECAVICCCCPCGLVNLLLLVVYKLPARLCRKALRRKRRRRMMKKGLLPPRKCGCDETELQIHPVSTPLEVINALESDKDVLALEKEMWDKFYSAGFWRSPFQVSDNV